MCFDKENPEFISLLSTFAHFDVKYVIVGGFAVNRYGYNRTTGDLDIYLKNSRENRENLILALEKMGYGTYPMLLDVPIIAGYCEVLMDQGVYADLMTDLPGLKSDEFDTHFEMATVDEINGVMIRFLHYNHLIENKKATNRPKDQLDVLELERINKKS